MNHEFCTLLTTKIGQFGYPRKLAAVITGFLCLEMMAVCAAMGVLNVPSEGITGQNTGSGRSPAGARAGISSPVFFRIR
jgi:hypothetical protein